MTKKVLVYFSASRLVFLLFAFLATFVIPLRVGYLGQQYYGSEPYLVWIWANFDGRHYLDIVENGYRNFNFAFFPLYPLVIKVLHYVFPLNAVYLGIIISLISFPLGLYFVYKLARLDYRKEIANLSILLLSFYPFSFFYNAVYSDSLFLFLSAGSFYFARKGNWLIAGFLGALTTLDRLTGVALIPALLIEWISQHRKFIKNLKQAVSRFWRKGFSGFALISLGFLFYLDYLQVKYGDFLIFQKSMVAWGQAQFVFPPQVFFRYLKIFISVDPRLVEYWISVLELVSTVLSFGLTYFVARKVRFSYAVFMFLIFYCQFSPGGLLVCPDICSTRFRYSLV